MSGPARFDVELIADGLRRFRHAELTVEADVDKVEDWLLEIKGRVLDASGAPMGRFTRKFVNRDGHWEAHHEALYLEEHLHDRGFGRAFQRFSEAIYRRHDVRQVSMMAEEVGSYAWRNDGFRLAGNEQRRREQFVDIWRKHGGQSRAQAAVDAGHVRQSRVDAVDALVQAVASGTADPLEPHEIGRLDEDVQWADAAGRQVWLGRVILTGASWTGVKHL